MDGECMDITLTTEQQQFMDLAKQGRNVLVDACIGSGKTTAIQHVCAELPADGRILYLTYNRRLLQEARARIQQSNVDVHTFHSFAGTHLRAHGIESSLRDSPMKFNEKVQSLPNYRTIVVDEYQDLERDLGKMLLHIAVVLHRQTRRTPQFLIVGDMDQKIYDYTRFDAAGFVKWLMDHLDGGWEQVTFSTCFRLPPGHAASIGGAWNKSIVGVNRSCAVRVEKDVGRLAYHLRRVDPKNLLVLGSNNGARATLQNMLEQEAPEVFNKSTVYSTIPGAESSLRTKDTSNAAIFTTFDSAKGLERDVCVVCDFTQGYLEARCKHSTSETILRNLFLVAASRGKREIVFYRGSKDRLLQCRTLRQLCGGSKLNSQTEDISQAFYYRRREDVDACLAKVRVESMRPPGRKLDIPTTDGMIDLGPCLSEYALARFFSLWDIEYSVEQAQDNLERMREGLGDSVPSMVGLPEYDPEWPLWKKVLFLTALLTTQERYFTQITRPFLNARSEKALLDRMATMFKGDEFVDIPCRVVYRDLVYEGAEMREKQLLGSVDVEKDNQLYMVVFSPVISDESRLSAALTAVATGKPCATVWNLYDNSMEQVFVSDTEGFLSAVCGCVTNGFPQSGIVRLPDTEPMQTYAVELNPGANRAASSKAKEKTPSKAASEN